MGDQEADGPEAGRAHSTAPETVALVYAVVVLLVSVLCPWVMWALWGAWLGLAGVALAQVLYMLLLKPAGICLGLPWLFTILSGALALISIVLTALWRAFH